MLTTAQADHFATFGFAVLRGFLADRATVLRAEADAAIRDAYAATYDERVIDEISGHYLPMAAYFDQLTAAGGALRLVPGSHRPEQHTRLAAYQRRQPHVRTGARAAACQASIPGYVATTTPGDMIAFDLHTWHASFGGRDRLACTAICQRCPQTAAERDRALRSAHDGFEQEYRGSDRDRYPVWRDWLSDAAAHPRRAPVIERMRHAGALDLPGGRDAW